MRKKHFLPVATMILIAALLSGCGLAVTLLSSSPPRAHTRQGDGNILPFSFSPDLAAFKAGFAKKKITPPYNMPQRLAGFLPSHWGLFVNDDIMTKCLTLEDKSGSSVGIVSLDLLGMLPKDVKEIQDEVGKLFSGKLLIHTTHTHSAPDLIGIWGFGPMIPIASGRDEEYINFVKKETVGCMKESLSQKRPAMVSFAETELKNVAHGPENDESLLVMNVLFEKGSVVLMNFAVHPDLVYSSYITADMIYYAYDFVEKETGSEAMYINGAIGAVQPNLGINPLKRWKRAKQHGVKLGETTLRILKDLKISEKENILWRTGIVRVEPKNKTLKKATKFKIIPDQRDPDGFISTEVNYVIIGDAGIITFPGEAFPNIARALKPLMPDKYKFTFGLTNAELGYILFSRDYLSGKHNKNVRLSVSPDIGDLSFETLKKIINDISQKH